MLNKQINYLPVSHNYTTSWLVSYLGDWFWPIFRQSEEAFFATIIGSLFHENSSNQLYMRISVAVIV